MRPKVHILPSDKCPLQRTDIEAVLRHAYRMFPFSLDKWTQKPSPRCDRRVCVNLRFTDSMPSLKSVLLPKIREQQKCLRCLASCIHLVLLLLSSGPVRRSACWRPDLLQAEPRNMDLTLAGLHRPFCRSILRLVAVDSCPDIAHSVRRRRNRIAWTDRRPLTRASSVWTMRWSVWHWQQPRNDFSQR